MSGMIAMSTVMPSDASETRAYQPVVTLHHVIAPSVARLIRPCVVRTQPAGD